MFCPSFFFIFISILGLHTGIFWHSSSRRISSSSEFFLKQQNATRSAVYRSLLIELYLPCRIRTVFPSLTAYTFPSAVSHAGMSNRSSSRSVSSSGGFFPEQQITT